MKYIRLYCDSFLKFRFSGKPVHFPANAYDK